MKIKGIRVANPRVGSFYLVKTVESPSNEKGYNLYDVPQIDILTRKPKYIGVLGTDVFGKPGDANYHTVEYTAREGVIIDKTSDGKWTFKFIPASSIEDAEEAMEIP